VLSGATRPGGGRRTVLVASPAPPGVRCARSRPQWGAEWGDQARRRLTDGAGGVTSTWELPG